MEKRITLSLNSEIGKLKNVILHTPGKEVENMIPDNAQRALYSDILNLSVVTDEYHEFEQVLKRVSQVHYVTDLLTQVLTKSEIRMDLINDICQSEGKTELRDDLRPLETEQLVKTLIEGLPLTMDCISHYLGNERFALQPLHNFFFTRDASISAWHNVVISKMANKVRERETHIMNTIFTHAFNAKVINPAKSLNFPTDATLEGGDVLIASSNVVVCGIGKRTTPKAVDFLISQFANNRKEPFHLIVQELPDAPESFIHLDMVFTFLDRDRCMIYEPLLLKRNKYQTIHMVIEPSGRKTITTEENILTALKSVGMPMTPLYCGGRKDEWIQEREQWHSGANFLAFEPGKVIGYARNIYTVEELANDGFEIITASDVVAGKINVNDFKKCMITLKGSELARGGGGARCMSMPVFREDLSF